MNKYRAVRTNGFASKFEAAVYHFLEIDPDVSDIKCQKKIYLTDAKILLIVDFEYLRKGKLTYGEAKGFETASWRIKRKLWKYYGPAKLEIFAGSHARPYLKEVVG
jgi:hypothetical protein